MHLNNIRLRKLYISIILTGTFCTAFGQSHIIGDSIKVAIKPGYDSVSKSQRFFFGENYRSLWATPVKMKVFRLENEKGGLKILQKGGGMQTKSLRLQDSTGQEWVIRTIQKYPDAVLPPTLRPTVAAAIIQDQISAEHPFAALTVPTMATALGVPHANPQVVYVPDDPALGQFRKDFANQVFLFEEREPGDEKTDNTPKAQKKLKDDNDNRVDQKLVLRARLLDMLLGDWDRHEDQWRWERNKDDDGNITYRPVPRDRDQVYNSANGLFPWLVSRHLLMAKFQDYRDHIRSINRWNLNARYFDRYFLNGLDEKDWREQIAYVQSKLTDEVITRAIKQMPDTIYKLSGPKLIKNLIARRSILDKQAIKYYKFISTVVEIPASDKREKFEITNQPDGQLNVTIHKYKDEKEGKITYQRTFDPKVTDEIRLYGFDGKDLFAVHGEHSSSIKVRMIGGDDEDTFAIDSNVHDKGNLYVYDRSDEKNNLPKSSQAHIRTSKDTSVNQYNSKSFKYNFLQPLILGSYNKDYGVQFIGDFIYEKQGFRKDPYAFKQSLIVNYGFGTNSLMLNYNGEFKQVTGKSDLIVNVLSKGPNYTSNFFGVGNNSQFIDEGDKKIHYYRGVYDYLAADVRLRHTYGKWTVSGGLLGMLYNGSEDKNDDRFLYTYNQQHPDEQVFGTHAYAGLVGTVAVDTRDKVSDPHKGIYWLTTINDMQGVNNGEHNYSQVQTEFSFYLNPDKDSTFVIANRIGGGTTFGNAEYFQQLKLGGSQNLRGFYLWRFTGKTMVFNNFELRLKLFYIKSYVLPGTIGIVGFNDVGRVWSPGESSDVWHDGYGGGIWFSPARLVMIQAVVGASKEGTYPYISAGFRF
ncbi:BamA/TamA family outer membrane protein [Mucilaginibacter jinjuensis]|uniref:BamA/TamA family outer membrane protein n=1 Tax=Mucilaginibacter jinjuensis TaxID=1176721 RepID=A0ABY7T565_9SPHI|nr:BamA/TamA family outer membrane protein [Mucilaginibacter jinjuensis]WCT11418.1 BamA/TamA family outer membrane protein [Mucilaginibacter jinjuensis]